MEKKEEKLKEVYKLDLNEVASISNDHKKIICPSCSETIAANDINIHDKIGKCTSCDAVFSIQKAVESLIQTQKSTQVLNRPEGVELFNFKDDLDITVQQSISMIESLMLMVFPAFAFITAIGLAKGKIDVIVPVILGVLSLIPLITLLFKKRHKIFISIDSKNLHVEWRPKFLNKDKHYLTQDIQQIYVKGADGMYSLNAVVDEGAGQKHVKLISNMQHSVKAKFLEQEIERYLGLENVKVTGEAK